MIRQQPPLRGPFPATAPQIWHDVRGEEHKETTGTLDTIYRCNLEPPSFRFYASTFPGSLMFCTKCLACRAADEECWVSSSQSSQQVSRPGDFCARCRVVARPRRLQSLKAAMRTPNAVTSSSSPVPVPEGSAASSSRSWGLRVGGLGDESGTWCGIACLRGKGFSFDPVGLDPV
jgi:hypothetical protein